MEPMMKATPPIKYVHALAFAQNTWWRKTLASSLHWSILGCSTFKANRLFVVFGRNMCGMLVFVCVSSVVFVRGELLFVI